MKKIFNYAVWNIELNDKQGVSIGNLSFKGLDEDGIVEIGYGINSGFENQGYMTEAVSAAIKWAAVQNGVKKNEAEVEPNNIASKRVLEKSGFIQNGEIGKEGYRYTYKGKYEG